MLEDFTRSFCSIKIMKIESDGLLVLWDSYEMVNTASSSQYANVSTIHLMIVSIENIAISLGSNPINLQNNPINLENGAISIKNIAINLENNATSLENSTMSLENGAVHYITTVKVV